MSRPTTTFGKSTAEHFAALWGGTGRVPPGRINYFDFAVLQAIAYLVGGSDEFAFSQSRIAQLVHASERGVRASIERLEAAGLVERVQQPGRITSYLNPGTHVPGRNAHAGVIPDSNSGTHVPGRNAHAGVIEGNPGTHVPPRNARSLDPGTHVPLPRHARALNPGTHVPPSEKDHSRDQSDHPARETEEEGEPSEDLSLDLSGDTPDTPDLGRAPDVLPWAVIQDYLPNQWLRADAGLRVLAEQFEDSVTHYPDHPWYGSRLVRSPHTIGGWHREPDPDYWHASE